jgi:hypothetical protein
VQVVKDQVDLGLTEPNSAGRQYRHGTISGYSGGGCKCEHRRGTYAKYRAQRRAAGKDSPRTPRTITTDGTSPAPGSATTSGNQHSTPPASESASEPTTYATPHASWLFARGADLQTVKERLGHGSIITTEKYLHTLAEIDDTALTALATIRARHRPNWWLAPTVSWRVEISDSVSSWVDLTVEQAVRQFDALAQSRNLPSCELVVHRCSGDLVVGVEQRLDEQRPDVPAAEPVHHPLAVAFTDYEARKPQFRQVLTRDRGPALRDRSEARHVELTVSQGPQHPDPSRISEQRERSHRGADLIRSGLNRVGVAGRLNRPRRTASRWHESDCTSLLQDVRMYEALVVSEFRQPMP